MASSSWIRGDQIGKGCFGTVSVAFHRSTGRVFAVKSVPVNSSTVAQVESIENEIKILRSLLSPFIVKYYGDDSTPMSGVVHRNLHLEYLQGGTASELANVGSDEEILRRCTRCIVSGLKYIHSRGIVHCDVKGKNVLLEGNHGTAKLADFGSAKLVEDNQWNRVVPRGSPLWMAPEVVRGESQGFESDVWALGCTVIEMVTGYPAWKDEGAKTLCRIGHSNNLPQFPTQLSDIGKDFLEKCLRRDPNRRWTCDQLLQHPFLSIESTKQIGDSCSPRSVIEHLRFEISDDDEEDELASSVNVSLMAGDRISKLAGFRGANWGSDSWVEVRCVPVGFSGDEEAGTSSVLSECLGLKEEFESAGDLGGGSGDEGLAALVVESTESTFTAVKRPESDDSEELMYLLLSTLCYWDIVRNMPFFKYFIVHQLSSIKFKVVFIVILLCTVIYRFLFIFSLSYIFLITNTYIKLNDHLTKKNQTKGSYYIQI